MSGRHLALRLSKQTEEAGVAWPHTLISATSLCQLPAGVGAAGAAPAEWVCKGLPKSFGVGSMVLKKSPETLWEKLTYEKEQRSTNCS